MPTRRRLFFAALVAILASGRLPASTGQERAQAAGATLIGTAAPPLTLHTIDGQGIDLSRLYGHRAVYLEFWATWCVPCRQQMPHLKSTFEHAGRDLKVIAVNAGFNDTLADVRAYRDSLGLKMPIVIDDGRLAAALHLRVTPQHIVIGRVGRILYIGHLADSRLDAALKEARRVGVPSVGPAQRSAAPSAALGIGASVPPALLTATDGAGLALADPDGVRPTVLMFMSPWCESYFEKSRPIRSAACKRAREQSERIAADARYRWVGIAAGLWADAADLGQYRRDLHVTIPLALDATGALFREFGVRDVPTMIVVDPRGRISGRIDDVSDHLPDQLAAATRAPRPSS